MNIESATLYCAEVFAADAADDIRARLVEMLGPESQSIQGVSVFMGGQMSGVPLETLAQWKVGVTFPWAAIIAVAPETSWGTTAEVYAQFVAETTVSVRISTLLPFCYVDARMSLSPEFAATPIPKVILHQIAAQWSSAFTKLGGLTPGAWQPRTPCHVSIKFQATQPEMDAIQVAIGHPSPSVAGQLGLPGVDPKFLPNVPFPAGYVGVVTNSKGLTYRDQAPRGTVSLEFSNQPLGPDMADLFVLPFELTYGWDHNLHLLRLQMMNSWLGHALDELRELEVQLSDTRAELAADRKNISVMQDVVEDLIPLGADISTLAMEVGLLSRAFKPACAALANGETEQVLSWSNWSEQTATPTMQLARSAIDLFGTLDALIHGVESEIDKLTKYLQARSSLQVARTNTRLAIFVAILAVISAIEALIPLIRGH